MTPLTVLADHLTRLEQQARARGDDEPALATVIAAMDEVQYMTSIIDNLALVAKLDAAEPAVVREPVSLDGVVERVIARHRPIAGKHGVALDYGLGAEPVVALGDVTMLEQALGNLVLNAIRYNHEGGHVAVVLEQAGEGFSLRVIDDGPGIPEADRRRLMARGARGDAARTREPRGQGLGLAIVFRVAALHGLTLTLAAAEGGGLEATLRTDGGSQFTETL
ncbi:MAG: HAMP domain-containing histidine kinase, partial [Myxococcales bacterium]|nr:HAMP domain-containing histidine kinase [Myxococcales bacterium]